MRKAFTVIEVIITFVILSILIFFAIYSFRYSAVSVSKASYYLPKNAMTFSVLDNIISGIYYYVIEKDKNKDKFVFYFEGKKDEVYFITVAPFFHNRMSISKLFYKEKKLLYSESRLYYKKCNLNKPRLEKNTKTMILFENVSAFELSYISIKGKKLSQLSDEIPKGIILKMIINKKKYHWIFSVKSNFLYNKDMFSNATQEF